MIMIFFNCLNAFTVHSTEYIHKYKIHIRLCQDYKKNISVIFTSVWYSYKILIAESKICDAKSIQSARAGSDHTGFGKIYTQNASGFASGVYYYRLKTRKLLLLK
jgi:hypothetical protein